ncbi:MAG: regulatory protein TetR [Cyanobacteria bacterium RYN_339]|nr:regulatory protein TetR [Cyanobacteria bacterium RYN_339]
MGRPKNYSREMVLERALPVFWKHGYAHTSLQELERATGVNRSGLYAEFEDKEDLFLQSLRFYLARQFNKGLLTTEPLGWKNVERFLKLGPCNLDGQKGCFSVASMRELPILPPEATEIVRQSRARVKQLLAKNIAAEQTTMEPEAIAELVQTFFTGLNLEQNLKASRASVLRKIDQLMSVIRQL